MVGTHRGVHYLGLDIRNSAVANTVRMGVVVEALDAIYSILKGFDVVILMPTGGWSGLFMAW